MENKQLFKVKNADTQLGGVSIGLADYFNLDVALVRVIFVILFFTPFPAFITYLVLWAVLPEVNSQFVNTSIKSFSDANYIKRKNNGGLFAGAFLIILGILFAFRNYFEIEIFEYIGKMWPLFFIGLGVWLIIREKQIKNEEHNENENKFESEIRFENENLKSNETEI